jgi:iron(III) transport system ATP-binding protein
MARLEISHLEKDFGGQEILQNISFTVESGALVAIIGASGGGKTTLLRLIAGFERPDAGEILLGGDLMAGPNVYLRPEQRGIGYVAQEGALFPHLSVADNITFGLTRAERRARHRVTELLALVDLPAEYAHRAPQTLSGGEQQRVALARALAPRPKLILLDEPFSALDAGLRSETRIAVAHAIAAAGATAILVTHDQDEALSMASQIGVLQNGVLSELRAPAALYQAPASAEQARFVGDAVFTTGIAQDGVVNCALGTLKLRGHAPEGRVRVMIRPEQIKLGDTAGSTVHAWVKAVTFYGHDALVELQLPGAAADDEVMARVFRHEAPMAGTESGLRVEGEVVAFPDIPAKV